MKVSMLTTIDNPYDPFDDFDNWFLFDITKGYNTCGILARIALTSDQLSIEENNRAVDDAINDIVRLDFRNIYKKNTYDVPEPKELNVPDLY